MYIRGRGDGSWHMFRSGCVNILICNLSHHLSSLILLLFPPFTHISSMWWYLLHRFSSGLPFCLTFQSYPPCVLSCCICLLFSITACRQHQKHQAQWRRTFQDHWLTHSESTRTHTHTHRHCSPLWNVQSDYVWNLVREFCQKWFRLWLWNMIMCLRRWRLTQMCKCVLFMLTFVAGMCSAMWSCDL